jgi:hypothetical protein
MSRPVIARCIVDVPGLELDDVVWPHALPGVPHVGDTVRGHVVGPRSLVTDSDSLVVKSVAYSSREEVELTLGLPSRGTPGHAAAEVVITCHQCGKRFGLMASSPQRAFDSVKGAFGKHRCEGSR